MRENSDTGRAGKEKAYLKSPYKFFGVSLPFTEKLAKDFRKQNPYADKTYVFGLAQRLWDSEYHEEKRLAVDILRAYKEFFIRKAIGWTLRELSKTEPDRVFDFMFKVKDRAAGLTLREGSKRLPEKQRAVLLKH